jgi:hypothetical protein
MFAFGVLVPQASGEGSWELIGLQKIGFQTKPACMGDERGRENRN